MIELCVFNLNAHQGNQNTVHALNTISFFFTLFGVSKTPLVSVFSYHPLRNLAVHYKQHLRDTHLHLGLKKKKKPIFCFSYHPLMSWGTVICWSSWQRNEFYIKAQSSRGWQSCVKYTQLIPTSTPFCVPMQCWVAQFHFQSMICLQ